MPAATSHPAAWFAAAVVLWSLTRLSTLVGPLVGPLTVSILLLSAWAGAVGLWLWRARPSVAGLVSLVPLLVFFALRQQPVEVLAAALLAVSGGLAAGVPVQAGSQRLMRGALGAVVVLLGIWSIHFMLTNPPTPYTALARFSGPVGDPNDLSQVVILAMVPALVRLPLGPSGRAGLLARLPGALVVGLGLTAVFASHSRAGIAIAVGLVTLVAARAARRRPLLAGLLAVALAVGVALVPFKFWWRFFRLLSGEDLGHRVELFAAGWRMFVENPLTGVGVGNFRAGAAGLDAHNLTVEVLAEGGLVAAVVWFTAAALVLRRAYRTGCHDLALLGPICLMLSFVGQMDDRVVALALAMPWFVPAIRGPAAGADTATIDPGRGEE